MEKENMARWIVSRLGQKGSYNGLFAPTKQDFDEKVLVYTGEKITSHDSMAHILGEEAMQALKKLKVKSKDVSLALEKSKMAMEAIIKRNEDKWERNSGRICCGNCSVAYWRSLSSGCLDYSEERLSNGLQFLKSLRDGKGRWRRFPFYYTLLALSEIDLPGVKEEFQYASQSMERTLNKTSKADPFGSRRKRLVEGILSTL
jgi:hypothetical protein